jgi:dolichol-phosphate mannosyltransferase
MRSREGVFVRVLIAIPVFNEIRYVGRVLDKVKSIHPDVLVVDDGSTDGTSQVLAGRDDIRHIGHPENRGYGQSIIDAFNWADAHGYEWVITMDCDEQHEPEMIPQFIRAIWEDRWDIVSGSRYLQTAVANDLPPGDRRVINAAITGRINDLLHLGLTDSFCGFKAHRTSAMMRLNLDEPGYACPMQLWPRAAGAGLRIVEIPVRLIYNDPTRHFGGMLDDPTVRLRHYFDVLDAEMTRLNKLPTQFDDCPCACG